MKTTIISQNKNLFLNREEYMLEVSGHHTPTEAEIVADLGKDANLTVVRRINRGFGAGSVVADIIVYDSLEAKEKNLVLPKKVRAKMEADRLAAVQAEKKRVAEEKKAADEAGAAEAAAKEAQAEEPAEEATTETEDNTEDNTKKAEESAQ
ncbi:MAG: ribosomal protein S24E [Patescibacteria group bacterium]|jgi:ribosomal protein S24E